MSRFHVGQRVRITHSIDHPEMVGKEATIIELNVVVSLADIVMHGYFHGLDVDGQALGEKWCCAEKYLQPIYDGNQLTQWTDSIWKPVQVQA